MASITALLGAGITKDIDGIMSDELTMKIMQEQYDCAADTKSFPVCAIYNSLCRFYNDGEKDKEPGKEIKVNFEDVFNALEIISSLQQSKNKNIWKKYKSPIGAFTNLNLEYSNVYCGQIMRAQRYVIWKIAQIIAEYNNRFKKGKNGKYKFFKEFWEKAARSKRWDIITLNYDTCIEECIKKYADGYNDKSNHDKQLYGNFNPNLLLNSTLTKILHIHGSILYGYPSAFDTTVGLAHEDLCKYSCTECAQESWGGRTSDTSQSGEEVIIGPIITGLRKTDKLLAAYPYSFYYFEMARAIINNSSILIAGYSFGDLYCNEMLKRIAMVHKNKRRIVIITFIDKKIRMKWKKEHSSRKWTNDAAENILEYLLGESFQKTLEYKNSHMIIDEIKDDDVLTSEDKCVRIYMEGFKNTVVKHGDEIIEFLSNVGK
jgi:hypothetical protein